MKAYKICKRILIVTSLLPILSACFYSPVSDDPDRSEAFKERYGDSPSYYQQAKSALYELDTYDDKINADRQDYHDIFYKYNPPELSNDAAIAMPSVSDMTLMPEEKFIADDKLISIAVTDDIPVKDILIEIARRSKIDMEIDPEIKGGIILTAHERPFSEVIERICDLANLRYSLQNGVIRIERDLKHIVNYRVSILNLVRTASSEVTSETALGSASAEGGSATGSTTTVTYDSEDGDIWQAVSQGVGNILMQYNDKTDDPQTASSRNQAFGGAAMGGGGRSRGGSGRSGARQLAPGILSLNKQAGVISVLATDKQHKQVKAYLDHVLMSYSSQVLIEAKVLEVSLKDEFRSGIDWSFLNTNVTPLSVTSTFSDIGNLGAKAGDVFSLGILPAELFGFGNTSLETAVTLVEEFGTTRTLSSPRINATNNQHAVLTFAENFVYFEMDVTQETDADNGAITLTVASESKTVPIGVILNLQPSIDLQSNEVVMSVRPTLTRITGFVTDPQVALQAAVSGVSAGEIVNEVPIVDVREIDSVLRIGNGQVMVIGGLMEERHSNTERGVPGFSKVPLIGNAFKSNVKESSIVETVIFIKATIIPGKGVSVEDQDFYKKFSSGRRQLDF